MAMALPGCRETLEGLRRLYSGLADSSAPFSTAVLTLQPGPNR